MGWRLEQTSEITLVSCRVGNQEADGWPRPEVNLIAVSRSTGDGVIVEYGFVQEFAFDLPTALRRLAGTIEAQEDKCLKARRKRGGSAIVRFDREKRPATTGLLDV